MVCITHTETHTDNISKVTFFYHDTKTMHQARTHKWSKVVFICCFLSIENEIEFEFCQRHNYNYYYWLYNESTNTRALIKSDFCNPSINFDINFIWLDLTWIHIYLIVSNLIFWKFFLLWKMAIVTLLVHTAHIFI